MTFFKLTSDKFPVSADYLIDSYGSAGGSACCILGSGKSVRGKLATLQKQLRSNQILPFSINWGGYESGQGWGCYPSIWTSYDYSDKFSGQLFRDPSVTKFVVAGRQQEWIQGARYTASECPNTYGIETVVKGIESYLGFGPIVDGKDSFIQAIDIAIRLGFKRIFLAGCDFFLDLNAAQLEWLNDKLKACPDSEGRLERFILGDPQNSLWGCLRYIAKHTGVLPSTMITELSHMGTLDMYHFGNAGINWEQAIMGDHHCYVSADILRQCRKQLDKLGVSVILLDDYTSPIGRLRRFFPAVTLSENVVESPPDYTYETRGAARNAAPFSGKVEKATDPALQPKSVPVHSVFQPQ